MKKTEALRRIEHTFWRLTRCCEHKTEWDTYLDIITEEEKGHRRFCPDGVRCGLTLGKAIRLFAVQTIFRCWIAEGTSKVFVPQAKDFFSIRKSYFAAFAIADMCGDYILKEFPLPEMADFLSKIDYAELNKDPRFAKAA